MAWLHILTKMSKDSRLTDFHHNISMPGSYKAYPGPPPLPLLLSHPFSIEMYIIIRYIQHAKEKSMDTL